MTRDQAIDQAQLLYNEPAASGFITEANFVSLSNVVHKEVCKRTKAMPFTYSFNLVDGTRTYMIPTYVTEIRPGGVAFVGTACDGQKVGPISLARLQQYDHDWRTAEGTTTWWYIAEALVTSGTDTSWGIGFYKRPSANVTNGCYVEGWRIPGDFANGSALPSIPLAFQDILPMGMCYHAAIMDMDRDMKNAKRMGFFKSEYDRMTRELRAHMANFGNKLWVLGGGGVEAMDTTNQGPWGSVTVSGS
jgi:hypothetical protein